MRILVRGMIALLCVTVVACGAALIFLDDIVDGVIQDKLPRIEAKLGHALTYGSVELSNFETLTLTDVAIGPKQSPILQIAEVAVDMNADALKRFEVVPTEVRIQGPTLKVASGGHLKGLAAALKALLPPRKATSSTVPSLPKNVRQLPDVTVMGASMTDTDGLLRLSEGTGTFVGGKVTGSFVLEAPEQGRCDAIGDMSMIHIKCERPYAHQAPMGFIATVGEVRVHLQPKRAVEIRGMELNRDSGGSDMLSYLTGLKIDMNLDLSGQVREQPLDVALHFPWGGYIAGHGYLHFEDDRFRPKKMSFSAQVRDFPLEQLSQFIRMGRLSGQYAVEVDLLKRTLNVEADGKVDEFWIEHQALSQKPVGGKNLAFGGQLNIELGQAESMGIGVHLTNGFFKLGELVTYLRAEAGSADLSLDTTSIQIALETPEVDAKILNAALPKGLLPDLEPIKAAGRIGLKAGVFIDFSNFDATRLEVYVPRKKLRIVRINPALNKKLRSLRSAFTLRHQLTTRDGVVVTQQRNIGPASANWVELEQVPDLLPRAMRLQEDGGFFRHKGISEFHIRGSLVSNLKSGRFRRGGSTITMQLARNLFLTKTKTLSRKLQEVILAFMLDGDNVYLTKDEIMALYLNIVELGPDIYGVKEAAEHYFDKQPLALTPAEIAWIVRLLPGPRLYYRSFQNGKLTHERIRKINRLLARFVNDDLIMAEQGLPVTRNSMWPNGHEGRAKPTVDGIPAWAVKKARTQQRDRAPN